jgi:hypothetical protein
MLVHMGTYGEMFRKKWDESQRYLWSLLNDENEVQRAHDDGFLTDEEQKQKDADDAWFDAQWDSDWDNRW